MFAFGESVAVLRSSAGRDRWGTAEFDVSHTLDGVGIEWVSSSEVESSGEGESRETVVSDVRLFCPVGADILASDKVELPDGDVYRVVGKPERWKSPLSGWSPGVVVRLRRTE